MIVTRGLGIDKERFSNLVTFGISLGKLAQVINQVPIVIPLDIYRRDPNIYKVYDSTIWDVADKRLIPPTEVKINSVVSEVFPKVETKNVFKVIERSTTYRSIKVTKVTSPKKQVVIKG